MPRKYTIVAILKIIVISAFLLFITSVFVFSYFYAAKGRAPRITEVNPVFTGKDILVLPYTSKSYAGYGRVFEPEITLKVKRSATEYEEITFLLDSGAVVSTLPISYTEILNKDIEDAKRIVLRGFGNKRSFGYMSNIDIKIQEEEFEIPVVFSEGETNKRIIGRNGFFDRFTIIFDHKDEVIRVAE